MYGGSHEPELARGRTDITPVLVPVPCQYFIPAAEVIEHPRGLGDLASGGFPGRPRRSSKATPASWISSPASATRAEARQWQPRLL